MLNLKSLYWLYTKISSKVSIMQIILIQTAVILTVKELAFHCIKFSLMQVGFIA